VKEGHIKPIIETIYPLDQSIEAFNTFEKGHSKGKIVIHVSDISS